MSLPARLAALVVREAAAGLAAHAARVAAVAEARAVDEKVPKKKRATWAARAEAYRALQTEMEGRASLSSGAKVT